MAAVAVAKGLYIGSQAAVEDVQQLGITHVLSVVNYDVVAPSGICHWQVHLEDSESANLIAELPAVVTWLERAMRQKGCKVLVHCNAGTSRSPAIVLAAIMKAKGLGLLEALDVLRIRAPHAQPNPGFMAQLELWAEMGYTVDESHPAYKQFMLDQVAAQWEEEGWVDPNSFAQLPEDNNKLLKLTRYRCRKCRLVLLTENNVIPQTGVGRRIFRRERYRQQQQQGVTSDQVDSAASSSGSAGGGFDHGSLFCEPLWWMQDQVIGPVQGKLYCNNCNTRLGSFNWAGITNSFGTWMIPGFQIHLSRLDVILPKLPVALTAMRFPAALAEHRQPESAVDSAALAECRPGGTAAAGAAAVEEQSLQQQQRQSDFPLDLLDEHQQQYGLAGDSDAQQQQQQHEGCDV